MFDFLKPPILAFQEFFALAGRAFLNIFRRPHYLDDIFIQMDIIGVGSLPIVVFNLNVPGNLKRVVLGEKIGSLVAR